MEHIAIGISKFSKIKQQGCYMNNNNIQSLNSQNQTKNILQGNENLSFRA